MSPPSNSPAATRKHDATDDERRERESQALWGMSAVERERAMWAGELSLLQLSQWSARRPEEVPRIGGEFAWIVIRTPDWAEANRTTPSNAAAPAR